MKNNRSLFALLIFSTFLLAFNSCSKKELPTPFNDASQTEYISQASLTAPCDSILVNGQIKSSQSFGGYSTFGVSVAQYNHFDYLEIVCSHYSSSNTFTIKLPLEPIFIGRKKYTLVDFSYAYGNSATLTHSIASSLYYDALSGNLYANYSSTQVVLSFCNVTVTDLSGNSHILNGKVTVTL